VSSSSAEPACATKYLTKLERAFKLAKERSWAYGSFSGGIYLVANFAWIGVLFYVGRLVLDACMTVGDLLSFIMYTVSLEASLDMMTSVFSDLMKTIGASKRVFDLIDREPKIPILGDGEPVRELRGVIAFRSVSFPLLAYGLMYS
jgi:ABC-type multidrug transport system fused ATPase/permease subunit